MQPGEFSVIADLFKARNDLLDQRAELAQTLSSWCSYQLIILPFLFFGLYHWIVWEVCALTWAAHIGSICLIVAAGLCIMLNVTRPQKYVLVPVLMVMDLLLMGLSPGLFVFLGYSDLVLSIRVIGGISSTMMILHTGFGGYYVWQYHRLTEKYLIIQRQYEEGLAWFQLIISQPALKEQV